MFFHFYTPTLALRPYVRGYMVMHAQIGNVPIVKPFPAGPDQCLYFYPRDPVVTYKEEAAQQVMTANKSIIVGPQTTRVNLELHPNHLTVAVFFQPGGLHALLGKMPMTEIFDFSLDSTLIWPTEMRELNEQLASTDDYNLMAALVESFLVRQYARNRPQSGPIDKTFQLMLNPLQNYSIEQLADFACLSTRQFRRKFYEKMGLSPVVFNRIVRFSKAFRLKENNPHLDWLDVICLTGYHDFSHLLRDFKEFAGTTPTLLSEAEQRHQVRIYTSMGHNLTSNKREGVLF